MKKEIQLNNQVHKVILTDADGVLLNWGYAFDVWMLERGYKAAYPLEYDIAKIYDIPRVLSKKFVREFNESAHMGFVPPLRDAMQYVRKLHEEHGYVFHLITSMSKDENAQKLRTMNIKKLFGETAFVKFIYLDTGADKDEVLAQYKGTGYTWVEDKVENAIAGDKQGLDSIVMEHGYNMDNQDYPLMKNWKDVYEYLVG
tara:strand:- start:18 stop:617 length:600 start_codon:yes stop_codon:yes gene_type:complete